MGKTAAMMLNVASYILPSYFFFSKNIYKSLNVLSVAFLEKTFIFLYTINLDKYNLS